jgi:hypothetical protein
MFLAVWIIFYGKKKSVSRASADPHQVNFLKLATFEFYFRKKKKKRSFVKAEAREFFKIKK